MRQSVQALTSSSAAGKIIETCESCRLTAYFCPSGVPTIGWGHTRTVTAADVYGGRTITREEAVDLLRVDIADAESAVRLKVKVPLKQHEFDALVSFVFNIRRTKWNEAECTLLRKLNKGDYAGPSHGNVGFQAWANGKDPQTGEMVRLGGLVKRRKAERSLWLGEGLDAALKHLR